MTPSTQSSTRSELRREIRAHKSRGASYAEAGRKVMQDGKPIGTAMAKYYAGRQEFECRGCLRDLVKSK